MRYNYFWEDVRSEPSLCSGGPPFGPHMAPAAGGLGPWGIAGLIGAGILGGSLLSSMGNKGAAAPAASAPPAAAPPATMPIADDQAAQDARKRQVATAQNRSGRASTILSQQGEDFDTLG